VAQLGPLTAASLKGKVVLVSFWTYTCINHFGEGEYDGSERMIQQLLVTAGSQGVGEELVSITGTGLEAPADWSNLKSPESYLGSGRRDNPGEIRFRVRLDGEPPHAAHGLDVDTEATVHVTEPGLHQLIRQSQPIVGRQLEIEFLDPGVEAFVFTFG